MIGQCSSNKNEGAIVSKSKNFSHLNKTLLERQFFLLRVIVHLHANKYAHIYLYEVLMNTRNAQPIRYRGVDGYVVYH